MMKKRFLALCLAACSLLPCCLAPALAQETRAASSAQTLLTQYMRIAFHSPGNFDFAFWLPDAFWDRLLEEKTAGETNPAQTVMLNNVFTELKAYSLFVVYSTRSEGKAMTPQEILANISLSIDGDDTPRFLPLPEDKLDSMTRIM
ncbi:MAG: hypothetical protein LBS89_03480, partial [Zoogloeaceae bacterium]|nr:hypothetical protein [Zoogloeaceae bacterium]